MHGRGAPAEAILGLAEELDASDGAWLAPQAAGLTWYPYSFLAPIAQNEPGITSGLGVLAGWRTEAEIVFDVPPSAFVPAPKVTSSVVHFRPRRSPSPCTAAALERVTQAAFGQRRKMLRQSLKSLGRDPMPLLAAAEIEPTARAEDIPVAGFVNLARAFTGAVP